MVDILVIGATGYTGQLIVRYLAQHPDRSKFSLAIAGRSKSKLADLKRRFSLPDTVLQLYVDVADQRSVDEAVQAATVVINAIGPYWTWGKPVLGACARLGKRYVDLSGEQHWIREMVMQFDYVASKTHAVIIPACGFDSVPSELAVFLANKTLKTLAGPDTEIASSVTAFDVSGALSGGTLATFITAIEQVPRYKIQVAHKDWALSTHLRGARRLPKTLVYTLPFSNPPVFGGLWFMGSANKAIVQRTWGLTERAAKQTGSQDVKLRTYGASFRYDEFMVTRSKFASVVLSLGVAFGLAAMLLRPIRWLAKKLMYEPGSGPTEEQLKSHHMEITNVTSSVATPAKPAAHVRTVIKGEGDPGYVLASVIIAESALALLLSYEEIPAWAREGGVLTPASALGDVLVKRLEASGQMLFESEVVLGQEGEGESRKRR